MSDTKEELLRCSADNVIEHDEEANTATIQCGDEMESVKIIWSGHVDENFGYHVLDFGEGSKPWISPPSYSGTNGSFEDGGEMAPTVAQNNSRFAGHWIQFEMPTPRRLESYRMRCGTIENAIHKMQGLPRGWTVLGSDSGSSRTWTVVHAGSRNDAMWMRNAKKVLTSLSDGDDVFLRNVDRNTYLAVTSGATSSHPHTDPDEDEASRGLMFIGSITPANRDRMVWKFSGGQFEQEDSKSAQVSVGNKLTIADGDDKYAHLGNGSTFSIEGPNARQPDVSKRLKTDKLYLASRARPQRSGQLEGHTSGTTDQSHWIFETDDVEKADKVYDAIAPSGEIKHPTAYKFFRFVFTATTNPSEVRVDDIRLTFGDGSGSRGPRWSAGSWSPACSPSDSDSKKITREVTCESGGETVPDSMCSGNAPAEESTCGAEKTAETTGGAREFLREWGLWIGLGFGAFILLIVVAMMFRGS